MTHDCKGISHLYQNIHVFIRERKVMSDGVSSHKCYLRRPQRNKMWTSAPQKRFMSRVSRHVITVQERNSLQQRVHLTQRTHHHHHHHHWHTEPGHIVLITSSQHTVNTKNLELVLRLKVKSKVRYRKCTKPTFVHQLNVNLDYGSAPRKTLPQSERNLNICEQ